MKNKLIFLCIFIFNLNYVLYNSVGISSTYKNGIRIFAAGLLIFSLLLNRKELRLNSVDLLWIFLLNVSLFTFSINHYLINFLYLLFIFLTAKDIDIDEFIKNNYYITILILGIFILFLKLGIIHNVLYIVGERVRSTFGFINVNGFSNLIYSFVIIFLLYKKGMNRIYYIFSIILVYIVYRYTDTRNLIVSFFIFLLSLILLNIIFKQRKHKKYNKLLKGILTIVVLTPIVITFLSPILLHNFEVLDIITSRRLTIFTNYITSNTLLNFIFGGTKIRDVDNGFLVLIYNSGILFTILVVYIIMNALFQLVEMEKSEYIAFIISFMYFNTAESLLVRPEISISVSFWFVIYKTMYDKRIYNKGRVDQINL